MAKLYVSSVYMLTFLTFAWEFSDLFKCPFKLSKKCLLLFDNNFAKV